jgi:hypothetical protein
VQSERGSADTISPIEEIAFGVLPIEQKPAAYYRAAAARARRLRAEATTRWLKDRLGAEIARYERIAEEIARASERGSEDATIVGEAALTSETPGQ